MRNRSKSKHPFLSRNKVIPQLYYVIVHDGVQVDRVYPSLPFGEAARHVSRRLAKRGEFQVWLEPHWERACLGIKAYRPLITIKV